MTTRLLTLVSGGVLLRREALAAGWSDEAIGRAVRAGHLQRIRQGAYVDRNLWEASDKVERHRLMIEAVVRAYRGDVVVSHQSAAIELGCPVWGIELSHVHINHETGSARIGASIVHHRATMEPGDVLADRPVTAPTRTALDVARSCPPESALIVVDDLLHRGLTTTTELRDGAARMGDWPGTLGHQVVLRLADGRHESPGESRAAYLFWSQRLPPPEPQYKLRRTDGSMFRVDFAWPELGVVVEFDGKEKYVKHRREGESVVDAVLRERRREREIEELTGWTVIRLTWADLFYPERVAARIMAAARRNA